MSFTALKGRIGFSDASFSIARTIKPRPIGTQTFPLEPVGTVLSFMGTWVPTLAVFSFVGTWVPSLAVVLPSRPFGTCSIVARRLCHCGLLSEPQVNLLLTPWLKAPLSVSPPSPAVIGSLGLRCFVLQARDAGCFLLHCFSSWSTGVTSLHVLRLRTLFHVLPYAGSSGVVCLPLSLLSRSAGPPARLSELTLLNTHLHIAVGGLLVLQHRSQFFRALRVEVVDSMSPALSWEATPSTGITSSGPAVSED